MNELSGGFPVLLFAGYATAAIAYGLHFLSRRKALAIVGLALLYTTVTGHGAWLIYERLRLGYTPFVNAHDALSFVAWGIALAYVMIELKLRQSAFGAFIIPVAVVFQAVSCAFGLDSHPPTELNPILDSIWFEIHVATSLFSYCAFAIAFASGVMFLFLFHELRLKHLGFFFDRLPPLEALERINYHATGLGFLFLTAGIVSGVIWTFNVPPGSVFLDAKEISAVAVWLLYAGNVHSRWLAGWRGQRTVLFSVANFVLLFVVFCVTSFVLKAHQF